MNIVLLENGVTPVKEAQLISGELKSPVITELQFTGSEDIALTKVIEVCIRTRWRYINTSQH